MFFERRRWARRIVERVCVNMDSQEATLLVHMIIWAAKHMPAKASKREAVTMAALGMAANQTAIARMAEELVVPPDVAQRFLDRIHGAAVALARENGMQGVEERGHAGGMCCRASHGWQWRRPIALSRLRQEVFPMRTPPGRSGDARAQAPSRNSGAHADLARCSAL
jgi:hypothetical protein